MLWQSTMMNALEDDGLLEDRAPDLVALVLRTLSPVYQSDASSRKAVRAFVTAAATRHQPFLKALTGGLIKRITAASPPSAAGGSVPTLNRSDALVLLQWSSLALSLLDSTPALKKAVPRLLDSIVVLLDLLASDPAVRWPSIMRSIGAVVSKRGPTLAAECLAAAERAAGAAGGAGGAGLLRLLQDVAIAPPVNQRKRQAERRLLEGSVKLASGEVRRRQKAAAAAAAEAAAAASAAGEPAPVPAEGPAAADAPSNGNDAPHAAGAKLISDVLAVYLERALGGKERASAATLASFDQLLSTLDASAFSARVMPPLLRTLKRNPEAAMVALSDLASRVDLDLSAAGVELLPLLVQQARLKEGLRALAVEGARRVVLRVRDGAALAVMVGAVTRVLDGSAEGKVKVASERGALVLMLTVLGEASAEVAAVAAPKAVAFLLAFYKDEIAEDVRVALLGALGVWLPCCGAAPPAAAVALLAAGVRDTKEGLRRAHLRAAVAALKSCPAMAAHLAPLVEGCSKNVADGCGKALLRLDGVLSLAVAAQVAAMDPAAAATLDKDKVWAMCLKADSALLAPATAAKFAPADAAAAAQLAATLLLHFSSKLAKADGSTGAVCRLLTVLLMHHCPAVRLAAQAAGRSVSSADPALLGPLMASPRQWPDMGALLPGLTVGRAPACVLCFPGGREVEEAPTHPQRPGGMVRHRAGPRMCPSTTAVSLTLVPTDDAWGPRAAQEVSPVPGDDSQSVTGTLSLRYTHAYLSALPSKASAAALGPSCLAQLLLAAHSPAVLVGQAAHGGLWRDALRACPAIAACLPGLGSSTFSGVSGGFRPVPGPTRPPFRANDAERANLPPNPPPPFTPLTIPPAPTLLSPLLNPTKKTHTHPASASAVVTLITGPLGLHSAHPPDNAAATLALGAAMSASPTALYPHVGAALATLLDRVEHDALTEHDLEVASTPEGMLCSERVAEGTYIPEVVENKNVKKARGRMRSGARAFAEDSSSDDEPAAAAKKPAAAAAAAAAVRPSQAASAASAGRGAGGAIKKSSTSREEAVRAMKMSQEAQTRSKVRSIRATLELGLAALSAVVAGNPTFAAQHLEDFEALAMPLMSSGLVGAPAFNAIRSLSTCLPGRLGLHSMFVAASLRLVVLAQRGARGNSYGDIAGKAAVADVVHALTQVRALVGLLSCLPLRAQCNTPDTPSIPSINTPALQRSRSLLRKLDPDSATRPMLRLRMVVTVPKRRLPSSSYCFVFPVLEAVLSSPQHTPLHEEALSVVSLHCSAAGGDIPRAASLGLLYHLLGVIPAYRSAHRRAMTASHPAAGADTHTSRRPVVRPSPGGRHQPRAAAVTSAVADPFLWHRAWAEAVPSRYTPAVGETHPASMRPRHRGVPAPACARASLGGVAHRRPPRPVSRANPWSASQTPPPPAIGSLQRSAHAPAHTWSVLPSERLEDA
ncbi:MAG: hypothetical protein WDW38_000060 [Sanguina aurantia]